MCDTRAEIARDVLSYLLRNPGAGDTLAGIVEWWLMQQQIMYSTVEVQAVLEEFISKQMVLASTAGDARVHYRINREKEEEIRTFLKGSE